MKEMTGESGTVRAIVYPQATPAPLTLELVAVLSPVFAAFVLVLAAACANVSNVMLARATARQVEIGIRLSLGAGRWRVVRELLVEGLMIAALSGCGGAGLASLVLRAGLAVFFATIPPTFAAVARVLPLDVDRRVFIFSAVIAALAHDRVRRAARAAGHAHEPDHAPCAASSARACVAPGCGTFW